jgi:hypothetical protein
MRNLLGNRVNKAIIDYPVLSAAFSGWLGGGASGFGAKVPKSA